jgi:hypothetical protein
MNEIVPRPEPRLALESMSEDALYQELVRGLTLTAEALTRLSLVWAELEKRGRDLSDLREGLARYLPLIAGGLLAAEAVVAFAGRASVLRALEGLPLARQRDLASGGEVEVIEGDGTVSVPLSRLPGSAIRLVFDQGRIRTPAQQRLALRPREKKPREKKNKWRPAYNPDTGLVQVGRMQVQLADLVSAISAAQGPDHPPAADLPEEYLTVKVRLHRDEYERLQSECRRVELPDWEMLRKALRAFGLI